MRWLRSLALLKFQVSHTIKIKLLMCASTYSGLRIFSFKFFRKRFVQWTHLFSEHFPQVILSSCNQEKSDGDAVVIA